MYWNEKSHRLSNFSKQIDDDLRFFCKKNTLKILELQWRGPIITTPPPRNPPIFFFCIGLFNKESFFTCFLKGTLACHNFRSLGTIVGHKCIEYFVDSWARHFSVQIKCNVLLCIWESDTKNIQSYHWTDSVLKNVKI